MRHPIKLGLIDDEVLALERLSYFISGIPGYKVEFAVTDPHEGLRLATEKTCDILITDVQMQALNGLLISERMEELGIPVIICSAYKKFALPSIDISVAAYILKPVVDVLSLKRKLEKVARKITSEAVLPEPVRDYFLVEDYVTFGFTKVAFGKLLYVEQIQNYTYFHAPPQVYKQRSTIQSVEKVLPNSMFARIHKSFIVNLDKVVKILPNEVILENGKSLVLTRTFRDALLNTYKVLDRQ
ncbi:response regulator transcription factor [Algoriphagus sp. H41]|uniref:Response regulator transcription factor n=1 Tax=Algoriphagus oliviformis TaxID=2811231 RepID=A0ABS3C7K4_9BACT|nr:LytTR family DNA-binding domain-containing protein [Algoriphagus oliviformis]MBN7813095.1 response regulator transcription factor [Algoriphagus oliviformis]